MKKYLYGLSVLSSFFNFMADVYGTADVQDDEAIEQPQAVAASSQPGTFAEWIQAVGNNTAPSHTNIPNSYTTFSSMRAFAEALSTNTSITKLNLQNSLIGDRSAKLLIKALIRNGTLESLNVKLNPISGYFLEKLLEVAQTHPTLKVIEYDDSFYLGLHSDEEDHDEQDKILERLEDLFVNRAPVVANIQMYAGHAIVLDVIDEDLAFPRLQDVIVNCPMRLSIVNKFSSLIERAPVLRIFELRSEDMGGFYEDNGQNTASGERFLDAVGRAHHLKSVLLDMEQDTEDARYSFFDITSKSFLMKVCSLIQTHPSLEEFSISVPQVSFNFTRNFRETGTGPVFEGASLHVSRLTKAEVAGALCAAESNLANNLVFDLNVPFDRDNLDFMSRVMTRCSFERITLKSIPVLKVNANSLKSVLEFVALQNVDTELDLMLPTSLIASVLKIVSDSMPNVGKVTYQYHPDLEGTDFQMHTSHIIGRRSLISRLLPLLDDEAALRALPTRHLMAN